MATVRRALTTMAGLMITRPTNEMCYQHMKPKIFCGCP